MSNKTDQFKGVALCLGGIILISPDSLLLRLINADVWTLVFYRGGLSALGLIIITSVLDRPQGWR
ncbi:MAG: EamA/RhaT family transporter, partial [Acidiferrobacteraceae bacterium]|nr:EamA/RhaT family transporter [Acidiferrobacteraceae bacterium]